MTHNVHGDVDILAVWNLSSWFFGVQQCSVILHCCRESSRKTPTTVHLKDGEMLVGGPAVSAVCIMCIILVHIANILFIVKFIL